MASSLVIRLDHRLHIIYSRKILGGVEQGEKDGRLARGAAQLRESMHKIEDIQAALRDRSIDAWLFGRREIVIAHEPRTPRP